MRTPHSIVQQIPGLEQNSWLDRNKVRVAWFAGVLAAGAFVGTLHNPEAAKDTYRDHYTKEGACLNQSPYDENKGAALHEAASSNGEETLSVTPASKYAELPVLHLVLTNGQAREQEGYFRPEDHFTGELLAQKCDYTTPY